MDRLGRGIGTKALVRLSIVGVLASAAAPTYSAQYYASVNCGASLQNNNSPTDAYAQCGSGITYPYNGFVSATATANGSGLFASAHGAGYTDGQADAISLDNYSLASGGEAPGSVGSLELTYFVHGLSADPSASGQVRVTADNPAMPPQGAGEDIVFEQEIQGASTVAGEGSLAVGVTLGVPAAVQVDLNLYSLSGLIDFSDTVELVGIGFLDSNGNSISGDVMGDGGVDYTTLAASNAAALGLPGTTTVPEPSTWAMLLIGFASLSSAIRYRPRGRAA